MGQISSYSSESTVLARRKVVAELLEDRADLLVVTGLGAATYDVAAVSPSDRNFYLWGAMGSAAMTGLGIALANPDRPVLVITGDGEQLMGLGALATIGVKRPGNLSIAVLDNGHYGETGMQKSHSSFGIGLHKVAAACNFSWAEEITDMSAVSDFRELVHNTESGPILARILVEAKNDPRVLPTRDCVEIKNRFREALGHAV
jgi:thiamine pyrophosphate-dependent acetolactate synthase large subunit-like protein